MIKKANQLDLSKILIKASKLIWFALVLDSKRNQSDLVRYSSTLIKVLSGTMKEYKPRFILFY
jgi:hypothetical protein